MIEIKDLTHGFGDKTLYKDVNITINKGDKIGLVGANGTGKSTLISLLNGTQLCDKGQIIFQGKFSVGYLDQYASVDGNKTIYEYLCTAFQDLFNLERQAEKLSNEGAISQDMKKIERASQIYEELVNKDFYSIESTIKKYASGLGIDLFGYDKLMKTLSGGQATKVILCKLLLQSPDFLILDEPTNHLDEVHIDWLVSYLNEFKGTFLIVSHDTKFLDKICNTIFSVEFNKIVRYTGNYSQFLKQHNEKVALQEKNIKSQEKKIEKLEEYIAKNSCRTNTARQAQSRQKQLDKIVRLEKLNEAPVPKFKFAYSPIRANLILQTKDLSIGYDYPLIVDINMKLLNGEKLAIMGFNGLGKTTLIKTILGLIPALSGQVVLANNLKIGYYEQILNWENEELTALQIMRNYYPKLEDKVLRGYLAKAGLTSKHLLQPIGSLSGGEQSKVKLCRLMIEKNNMLILDEPTNHIDVKSKQALASAIKNFEGTVILVSHELDFVKSVTDNIFRPSIYKK